MGAHKIYRTVFFLLTFFTAQAQDTFYEEEPIKVRPKRLYLVAHVKGFLTPIPTRLNGSPLFSESPRNLNPGYEFTLGTNYNDKLEISAGLRRLALYTGYTFRTLPSSTINRTVSYKANFSYWQLPIRLSVRLWKLTRSVSIWSVVGGALSRHENGVHGSQTSTINSVVVAPNGTPNTLVLTNTIGSTSGFVSGEVGINGHYTVSKRLSLAITVMHYFSKKNLLTLTAKTKDDLGKEYVTNGQAGLNTFSYSAGLSIRLNR